MTREAQDEAVRADRTAPATSRGWDAEVGIVGAGPAGARTAELLAGLGVGLLWFDPWAPWEKPCGGGLPAAAFRNVPELEEVKPFAREIRRMRLAVVNGPAVVVPLREPLYVLARRDLAAWQLARARAGGATLTPVGIAGVEPWGRGWRLRDEAGRLHRVRRLVGADGAASRVRHVAAPGFHPELAPTRVTYPWGAPATDGEEILFAFFRGVRGYLWDFPRPHHRSVGVGVAPGSWGRSRMDGALLGYLDEGAFSSGDGTVAGRVEGAVIGTAMWPEVHFRCIGGPDFALLGDAAGLADPATGEGIEYALRSAGLAAESYACRRDFSLYPTAARSAFARELRMARLIRRWAYRDGVVERVIAAAVGGRVAHRFAHSLVNCGNEHLSWAAFLASLFRRLPAPVPSEPGAAAVLEVG